MNQILYAKIKNKHKTFFKIQFIISIIILIILIGSIFYYMLFLQKKEKLANNLIGNYSIYQLYSNYSKHNTSDNISNTQISGNNIFGIIEIPKINIYYPVFSYLNEELLKISPCKFYGDSPKVNGNICIAGHNYNNSIFFSNLFLLNINDEIFLYDNYGRKYIYKVFKSYEVIESDLSPIFDYNQSSKELTLITCNNLNNNRLVVKANFVEEKRPLIRF